MRDVISDEQIERFWRQVEPFSALDACWLWVGSRRHTGGKYGEFTWGHGGERFYVAVHRMAYRLLIGEVPDGLTLDHLCRNTLCVNPDHLEPVTRGENVRRGFPGRKPTIVDGVQVCLNCGEAVVGDNAMPQRRRRSPRCRACAYESVRKFKERQSAA